MEHNTVCLHCSNQFTSRKKKKFCTQKCYFESKDKTVTLKCVHCLQSFTKPYRFRESKTCSRECFSAHMSKIVDTSIKKKCLACGNDFDVPKGSVDKTKFCSYDCFLSTRKTRQPPTVIICKNCKKEFSVNAGRSKTRQFCGKSCANSGEFNVQYDKRGKKTGRAPWSKGLSAKTDERLRKASEKISIIISDKIINGEWKHNTGFKGEHFIGKKNEGKEVYLRSSYESKYARMLDIDDNVCSWEHEPLRIPYFFNGSIHNYVPDFLVKKLDGSVVLVEVKPNMLTETLVNLAKQSAAQSWCELNGLTLITITEHDLILIN